MGKLQPQLTLVLIISLWKSSFSQCPVVPANGCSVCGDDLCVGNPSALLSSAGELAGITCGQLQEAGFNSGIPLEQCPLFVIFLSNCECSASSPTLPPNTVDVVGGDLKRLDANVTTTMAPIASATTEIPFTEVPFTDAPITQPPSPITTSITSAPTPLPVTILPVVSRKPVVTIPVASPEFTTPTTLEVKKGGKKGKEMSGKKKKGGKKKGKKGGKKNIERPSSVIIKTLPPTPNAVTDDDFLSIPISDIPFTIVPVTLPPQDRESPVDPPFATESPVDPPFATESPVDPPFATESPVDPPFATESPVDPSVETAAPNNQLASLVSPLNPPMTVPVAPVKF
jgi:hypothetical protein